MLPIWQHVHIFFVHPSTAHVAVITILLSQVSTAADLCFLLALSLHVHNSIPMFFLHDLSSILILVYLPVSVELSPKFPAQSAQPPDAFT